MVTKPANLRTIDYPPYISHNRQVLLHDLIKIELTMSRLRQFHLNL